MVQELRFSPLRTDTNCRVLQNKDQPFDPREKRRKKNSQRRASSWLYSLTF